MLDALGTHLKSGAALTPAQIEDAVERLVDPEVAAAGKAEFLTALAVKGESIEEIEAFAKSLLRRAVSVPLDDSTRALEILDVCGTGGDRLNTFNISTAVAFVAAAGGLNVAKHGNRAITSNSGSADVLEALGIRIDWPPQEAARVIRDHGFVFLFAPAYHPTFKHIGPARRLCAEQNQRTVFNFLGPLLNPVRPTAQLVGVSRSDLCEPIARVLQSMGVRRAMVVCGRVGDSCLDELSTLGESTIAEFYQDRGFSVSRLSPGDRRVQGAVLADLAGGDKGENAAIVTRVLGGQDRGPKRDAVLLNAGAALFVGGKTRSIAEGWELAEELIDSGRVIAKLEALRGVR